MTAFPSDPPPVDEASLPSPTVRGLVSLALFIHLFIVLASGLGGARARSDLVENLRDVPGIRDYREVLQIGPYSYHLTYNVPSDEDHFCEIVLDWRAGMTDQQLADARRIELQPEGLSWWPDRRRRYQLLAYHVAQNAQQFDRLTLAITRRMLAEHEITQGDHRFRCRRQRARSMDEQLAQDEALRDPNHPRYFETAYEADVGFLRGQPRITGVGAQRDTVPVDPAPTN
jgi:hypothetical protein